jgi:tetratricopeptide (TPR) repeat protein
LWCLAAAAAALAVVALGFHRTPFYGVETDLLGDLVPSARALRAGNLAVVDFQFKGPGYPLLLAGAGWLAGGDDWLAARLLSWAGAVLGAWLAFRIARRFLGDAAALFVGLGLFLNPVWLTAAIEAGTDMPAFALSIAATWLALSGRRPAHWLAAGFLASCAFLTRYNAVFLPAAAAVAILVAPRAAEPADASGSASALSRWRKSALYAAGFVLPVGAWVAVCFAKLGALPRDLNYLNVAYEIYGRGVLWDRYWGAAAARFHSLGDVLAFDPARAFRSLGLNAALRWWRDVRVLTPFWIGLPALAGMVLVWPRRRESLPVAAHFVLAYLVLASVFYTPRFFIYLIPFHLMGAAALVFHGSFSRQRSSARETGRGAARGSGQRRAGGGGAARLAASRALLPRSPQGRTGRAAIAAWIVAAVLLAASGAQAVVGLWTLFANAPDETRLAGLELRHRGERGARIFARKPHVAYFAGMDYVPMPDAQTFRGLLDGARAAHVDYLFFSGIEARLRVQFLVLADSGTALPGLRQLGWRFFSPDHFYAVYRFTGEPIDTTRFDDVVSERVLRFAARHPDVAAIQSYAGSLLFDQGRAREALAYLERASRLDPGDPETLGRMAWVHWAVGDVENAGQECERLITEGQGAPGVYYLLLGAARATEGRLPEARSVFQQATERDPMDPAPFLALGISQLALGAEAAGRQALDRSVVLLPGLAGVRRAVLADFNAGGRPERALTLLRRVPLIARRRGDLTRIAGP